MDLALNNQQWLICHKTKPNNLQCLIYHKTKPNQTNFRLIKKSKKYYFVKFLQYFRNVKQDMVVPCAFAKIGKVKNHIVLGNAEFTWYSSIATHQTCLCGLKNDLGIFVAFLIFPDRRGSCKMSWIVLLLQLTEFNCTFPFSATNVCFRFLPRFYGPLKTLKVPELN